MERVIIGKQVIVGFNAQVGSAMSERPRRMRCLPINWQRPYRHR